MRKYRNCVKYISGKSPIWDSARRGSEKPTRVVPYALLWTARSAALFPIQYSTTIHVTCCVQMHWVWHYTAPEILPMIRILHALAQVMPMGVLWCEFWTKHMTSHVDCLQSTRFLCMWIMWMRNLSVAPGMHCSSRLCRVRMIMDWSWASWNDSEIFRTSLVAYRSRAGRNNAERGVVWCSM